MKSLVSIALPCSIILYFCQNPATASVEITLANWLHQSWGRSEGVPGMVRNIVRTADGYLWLGTQHGLVRFDGVSMALFTPNNTPGLRSAWIGALLADRSDKLWI